MTDISVDTAVQSDGVQAETPEVKVEGVLPETEAEGDEVISDDGAPDSVDKEMKTIKKALNKKNRYIDNQRSKIRALETEMQQLRSTIGQNKKPAPQMEQFDSVLDYVKADSAHLMEQKFTEQQQQQQLSALEQQQLALRAQQDEQLGSEVAELVASNAEAKAILTKNLPVIQAMPKHIEDLLYEIDDAPSAIYALSREGRLQDIYYMNPYVAAAELVQAQNRGQQYLEKAAAPQKQPPKPLDGLKGRGTSSRNEEAMSGLDLLKKYNLK